MQSKPLVVVVSGPGGVGKSTVVKRLIAKYPQLWLSRSWTTRQQRPGESSEAYNFVTEAEFLKHVAEGGFLEYTNFLGNYYGSPTPKATGDQDIVLEIEVDGARQVLDSDPKALLIFLEAPSIEEQTKRLNDRGDDPDKIQQRLIKSAEEANAGRELGATIIVNNDIEETTDQMWSTIQAHKSSI